MNTITIPATYHADLNLHDTQIAIKTVKDFFQQTLSQKLNLLRVSAPTFVAPESGLNDNLNGVERPVSFDIKAIEGSNAEIVHSLAKWKRYALKKYGFSHGEGLYTDMVAIRRDEDLDNIHSVYVDQWDWERSSPKKNVPWRLSRKPYAPFTVSFVKLRNTWLYSMTTSRRSFQRISSLSQLRSFLTCIRTAHRGNVNIGSPVKRALSSL